MPLGIAFLLRSQRAERLAGLAVVAAIFISACVAAVEAVDRLVNPHAPDHVLARAAAGVVGYLGNWIASQIRTRAGRRLDSPALIVVALGLPIADPLIGLAITLVILRITWDSWNTVRGTHTH